MKTNRLLTLLIGAFLTGNITGCGNQAASIQPPPPPPQIEGYDDSYWVWDEEDGEWEYNAPGSAGHFFYYGGKLHKSSITTTPGFKSTSIKSGGSSKSGGFGSGAKGGGFGG